MSWRCRLRVVATFEMQNPLNFLCRRIPQLGCTYSLHRKKNSLRSDLDPPLSLPDISAGNRPCPWFSPSAPPPRGNANTHEAKRRR